MFKKQLLEKIILPLGDRLSQQCVMQHYKFAREAQSWPIDRLETHRNKKLQKTILIAYNDTVLYRRLMDEAKIKPNDICTISDLKNMSIVTKDILREAYPDLCTRKTKIPYRELFTSGSTGRPFTVRVDNNTLSISRALMLLRANYSGWEIGDKILQTGMNLDRGLVKKGKDIILRSKYVSAFNLSDKVLDNYLEIIDKKRIKYIMGYAASIYCIAERASKVRFNQSLKGVVTWGDNLYKHYRNIIEKQFQCRVTDTYGCGEGIQVAAQCEYGNYHIFMPYVIVEFINQNRYKDGVGEILLTSLTPGAMPLIRYKVGDIGRPGEINNCLCGRNYTTLKSIEGRDTDIVRTPNGNKLIVHFFTGLFEYETTIDTFQVIQNTIDSITVKIVPFQGFNQRKWNALKKKIQEKGDSELKVNLEIVKIIPLENSNKRRFVISSLDKHIS